MPSLTCTLQLCPSSQKLSSGPESGPVSSTQETKRELKYFLKLLCYSTSSWTSQNFISDWFLVVQGYVMCLHHSGKDIYIFPTKRAEFLRQRKKLFSPVPQACQTSLISKESLITKRVSPFFHRAVSVISVWGLSLDIIVGRNVYLSWS